MDMINDSLQTTPALRGTPATRIAVLGGGESGVGAAVLARKKGFDVFLSDAGELKDNARKMLDSYDIPYEEGGHSEALLLSAAEVVKSPGIPDRAPVVKMLHGKGIPVISEIEFAGRYCRAKKICITGSNGKTTTTSIIYFLLKNAGLNVGLAGNIGSSYAYQVATENYDYYVLELSSFQLDGMFDFKADIAVLLNITPDHLDRYDNSLAAYARAKFRIVRNMQPGDCFIFCSDDEITMSHLNDIVLKAQLLPFSQTAAVPQGAYTLGERLHARYHSDEFSMHVEELALAGKHNVYNSMAAAVAGQVLQVRNEVIRESLATFRGVEHRLEPVLKVRDVLYINDSKATNVNAAWYALESMRTKVIWIAGGTDKGNDYADLFELAAQKVKALICLGIDNEKLHRAFAQRVPVLLDAASIDEAVGAAYRLAEPGDTVLLSPACASFDLFKNYEDRGRQFKEAVRRL
ncbi:MAG: UDP-N-acetylmuramoyl-L-alanine--D-glutamate ligase [Prevotellaceae bacterium]|jgi:UDP-N-acetylmuramoylalanine--D-glutamate ligase|nr:UDP-N-acetylmuramoyl-L-alanine--D-glutamate ligase [Prevotellaceae bacterium]